MTAARTLELLKIERECIQRNCDKKCDRDCGQCDLVQKDEDLVELYDELIEEYELKTRTRVPRPMLPNDLDSYYWR